MRPEQMKRLRLRLTKRLALIGLTAEQQQLLAILDSREEIRRLYEHERKFNDKRAHHVALLMGENQGYRTLTAQQGARIAALELRIAELQMRLGAWEREKQGVTSWQG